jgi:hypothetical protein
MRDDAKGSGFVMLSGVTVRYSLAARDPSVMTHEYGVHASSQNPVVAVSLIASHA